MSKPEYWSLDDFESARCHVQDIGQLKQSVSMEVAEVLGELPPATMAEMKQAALRVARGKMGFDKFFEAYPNFHHKFLLAISREPAPPLPQHVTVELSWISKDRLSYKNVPLVIENAVEPNAE
jgi:hypothetical protein